MSKLKVAKAVRKSFAVIGVILKWAAISAVIGTALWLLWLWMNAHFLSFAIVIGIILAILAVAGIVELWDWSGNTIEEAEAEEREAQARERAEKLRRDNPHLVEKTYKTVPNWDEDLDWEYH